MKDLIIRVAVVSVVSILGAIARSIASKSKAWWRQRKLERTPFIVVEQTEQFSINFHKSQKKSKIIVQWIDVRQVELTSKGKKLILHTLNNEQMEFKKNKIYYWNDVVKAVPDVLMANAAFIEYRFRNFSGLNSCRVCGKVAAKKNTCWHCGNDTYTKYYHAYVKDGNIFNTTRIKRSKEIISERGYYSNAQLFWFAPDKHGAIDFYKKDMLYANDSEWKPLIKANEIREFWKNPSNKDKVHDPSMQRFRKKIDKYKMVEYKKIE